MDQTNSPRWVNIVLGVWLIISAFLWSHTESQFANAWVVGAGAIIAAAIAMRKDAIRYVNMALAVWLFLSIWLLPTFSSTTVWNNVIVAILMFIVAALPQVTPTRTVRRAQHHEPVPSSGRRY